MDTEDQIITQYIDQRYGICAFRALAIMALIGCITLVFCDVLGALVKDDYNSATDTISALAYGQHAIIMDMGLVIFALGILALAGGLALRSALTRNGLIVRAALITLALSMAFMSIFDGAGEPFDVHDVLVILSSLAVPIILWLTPTLDIATNDRLNALSRRTAVAWVILAPVFELVPSAITGAYERALTGLVIAAIAIAAVQLYRTPRRIKPTAH